MKKKTSDSVIWERKDNQYFLTRKEIMDIFDTYINKYNGVVKPINKHLTVAKAKGQDVIKTDWSSASARRTDKGLEFTYLTQIERKSA